MSDDNTKEPSAEARAEARKLAEQWNANRKGHDMVLLVELFAAALDAKKREHDEDIGGFQQKAYALICKLSGRDVDGAGSDACWHEFTLAEIAQGLNHVIEERDNLKHAEQQLEALRMVVVKWQGYCRSSNQVQETDECVASWNKRAADAEQQLEQAVRLLNEYHGMNCHNVPIGPLTYSVGNWLSSPAIAPIRERLKQKEKV